MRIKSIVLGILLVCAIAISFSLYHYYTQENISEQEAYEVGENILTETTRDDSPIVEVSDSGHTWHVHALCKYDEQYSFYRDYFVKISKRTGKVVKVGWRDIDREEYND